MSVGLSILMPVYNERRTVERAIEEALVADLPLEHEVVVVDDGSTDGTSELLAGLEWGDRTRLVSHDRNRGKGAAIRTALTAARGTYSAILDADLEYSPQSIAALLEPLLSGEAEVVFGVRGFQSHSAYNFWYVVGNKTVNLAANLLYNTWISDIMTCYKVMLRDRA
jgi:glycosyltransferase involved in cell wall biosynthesis